MITNSSYLIVITFVNFPQK